ncbi:MAG: CPBP family intramembrane glutamic endopeptidase, partial [Spirochaetota bacterium]
NYSLEKALLVSALLFAASHMNAQQFAGAFVLGVYLGYVFRETRSLSLCVGAHLLNNAMPFLYLHLLDLEIPGFTAVTQPASFQPLWLDLLGVTWVGAGAALTWLHYRCGKGRGMGRDLEQG